MEHESAPLVDDTHHLIKPKQSKAGAQTPGTSKQAKGNKKAASRKRKVRTPEEQRQISEKRQKALAKARAVRKANLELKQREHAAEEKAELAKQALSNKQAAVQKKDHVDADVHVVETVDAKQVDFVDNQDLIADEKVEALDRAEHMGRADTPKETFDVHKFPVTPARLKPTDTSLLYRGLSESQIVDAMTEPTTSSNRYKQLPDVNSPFEYTPREIEALLDMVNDREPTSEVIRKNTGMELSRYEDKLAKPALRAYVDAAGMSAPTVNPAPPVEQYTREMMSGRPSYQRTSNFHTGFAAIPPDLFM